jgi:hypothetical protein
MRGQAVQPGGGWLEGIGFFANHQAAASRAVVTTPPRPDN